MLSSNILCTVLLKQPACPKYERISLQRNIMTCHGHFAVGRSVISKKRASETDGQQITSLAEGVFHVQYNGALIQRHTKLTMEKSSLE